MFTVLKTPIAFLFHSIELIYQVKFSNNQNVGLIYTIKQLFFEMQ